MSFLLHGWQITAPRMYASQLPRSWSFDIGFFLVLLGEQEEINYRQMQRSLLECLSAAPVAGLQSYMKSRTTVFQRNTQAPYTYTSPLGCKTAELRNLKLHHTINVRDLLCDGRLSVYRSTSSTRTSSGSAQLLLLIWVILTWCLFAATVTSTIVSIRQGTSTWIGLFGCTALVSWSIIVRLLDLFGSELMALKPTDAEKIDAAIFLGRRQSCFVLEGSRRDVLRWTGTGVQPREGTYHATLAWFSRIGSTLLMVFIFAAIPNGTTYDQLAFIILAIIGQLNVVFGQRLNAKLCMSSFHLVAAVDTPTRTHVYAELIKRFGNGCWIGATQLLPRTPVWADCSEQVKLSTEDPKALYERIDVLRRGLWQAADSGQVTVTSNPNETSQQQPEGGRT